MPSRFWVGGAGTWDSSATTHWSATDGGASGASAPTSTDDVFFTSLSNATAYAVTIGTGAVCQNVTFAAPASGNMTLAGSAAWSVFGNFTAYAGLIRTYSGSLTFASTATGKTITTAGVVLSSVTFDGVGGQWAMQDAWTIGQLILTRGTLDTNNQTGTISVGLISSNTNTRGMILGSSTITVTSNGSQPVIISGAGLTLNAGTSTLILNVAGVFANIFLGGYTYYNLTLRNSSGYAGVSLSDSCTVTNIFTATGLNANTTRFFLSSSVQGTARTITANGTIAITNVDFQDITGAGSGTGWATGTSVGNCGNNSGITFTTPATVFWIGGSGNLGGTANYSTSSGGASGAAMPLIQDTLVFDSNSFSSGGQIVTNNVISLRMPTIDFTNATNTPTFALGTNGLVMYGSVNLTSATKTGTATLTFQGTSSASYTLKSNGQTFQALVVNTTTGGLLTLSDALTITASIAVSNCTFNTGNQNVTAASISGSDTVGMTITLGSSLVTLTGTGTVWSISSNRTLNAGTSTIKLTDTSGTTKTFTTGGKIYNIVWLAGGGAGIFLFTGGGTISQLKGDTPTAASTLQFTAATTTTIADWQIAGTLGHVWTLTSSTAANHTLRFTGSAPITTDYLDISRSNGSPGYKWFAGTHSVNSGNNSGWIFGIPGANKPQEITVR